MAKTGIVIPSYCSLRNLRAHLPGLLEEVRPCGVEVIVTDDASPDGSADRVAEEFPEVRILRREVNGGFGENCNSAMRATEGFEVSKRSHTASLGGGGLAGGKAQRRTRPIERGRL